MCSDSDDEDLIIIFSESDQIRVPWRKVKELAQEAGARIWRRVPPEAHVLLHGAAVLALTLFSKTWLLESCESVAKHMRRPREPVRNPLSYLPVVLAGNCIVIERCESIRDRAELKIRYAAIARPAEELAASRFPQPAAQPDTAPRATTPAEEPLPTGTVTDWAGAGLPPDLARRIEARRRVDAGH